MEASAERENTHAVWTQLNLRTECVWERDVQWQVFSSAGETHRCQTPRGDTSSWCMQNPACLQTRRGNPEKVVKPFLDTPSTGPLAERQKRQTLVRLYLMSDHRMFLKFFWCSFTSAVQLCPFVTHCHIVVIVYYHYSLSSQILMQQEKSSVPTLYLQKSLRQPLPLPPRM